MSIDIVVYNASEIQLTDREAFTTVTQGLQWKGNGSMYLTLSSDGCKYPGSFNNCTAACLNPNVTFKDPQTLGNCVAYPWISRSISNGLLSILGQAVAEEFNIWSDTAYPQVTTAIVQIQNQCWNQWITHADSIFFSMDSPKWSEICGGDYSGVGSVNTDIGGVGVCS